MIGWMVGKTLAQTPPTIVPPINPGDLPGGRDLPTWEAVVLLAINSFILPILAGLAVMYIIWSGYQFLSTGGDPAKAEKARANLTYAVIGVILVIVAYFLVRSLNELIQVSRPS